MNSKQVANRFLSALALSAACSTLGAAQLEHPVDLTGTWYAPTLSGQGMQFDVWENADGTASILGGWFTFSLVGVPFNTTYPLWYSMQAPAQAISFGNDFLLSVFYTPGGVFAAPSAVQTLPAGRAIVRFTDCSHAYFYYDVKADTLNTPGLEYDDSGSVNLVRLTGDAGCDNPVANTRSARGFSGTWYDPSASGQGMILDVNDASGGFLFGG